MAKYKVSYSGFVVVEADSPEEAEELYFEDYIDYEESQIVEIEEIDEFAIY